MNKRYLLFLFFIIQYSFGQANPDDKIEVSILTVGVADESHSLYGHTAIRIKDEYRGTDDVYNYGMFDFGTPNFILRFVKGDMQYFAGSYPYADFEENYRFENRSIYQQILRLPTDTKLLLIQALQESTNGDEKFYTYKFIDRNCTTKVIDVLNDALQEEVIGQKNTTELTYREVLYPYAENHFFQRLGINIIFGTKVDSNADKIFLPFDLKNNLENTQYNGEFLVGATHTLFEAKRFAPNVWWDSIYTLLAFLLLIALINQNIVTRIYFVTVGLLGIFFITVGFYSFHKELQWNYNVLLFNPVYLFVVYFSWQKKRDAFLWFNFIALASIAVYSFYILSKIQLKIVWPFIIIHIFLLVRGLLNEEWKEVKN